MSESGAKTRKGVSKTPISIEEIFNQVSIVAATNVNPAPGRVLLTPRSAEVCLKLGVNPETMKIRDVDSFWEPGIDPTIQRMRHEAYVTRRYDLMKQCRLERKKLINQHLVQNAPSAPAPATGGAPQPGLTPEKLLEQQKEASSTLVLLEMKRMEKMQQRQERELEQMLAYEVNRAKVEADMQDRIEAARKKEEMRVKQQEKRMKLMAEERRLKEMQKVAQEEMEEAKRRKLAKDMFERERVMQEQKAAEAASARRAAKEAEKVKLQKQQEHRASVQRYFAEEQMQLRKRLENMQGAEKKKQDALMIKQEAAAKEVALRRAQAEERITRNMEMAKAVVQKRTTDFLNKQEHHEKIRAVHLSKQDRERELHAQENLLGEQRRRMILIQKRKEVEAKAESMLKGFEEEELHVMALADIRKKENDLIKEKSNLKRQMKAENVARVERVNNYKRLSVLKNIEDVTKRVDGMMTSKAQLIKDRREMAIKSKVQKEKIAGVMEKVRTNASLAAKIIGQAMSGSMSLKDLMEPEKPKNKSRTLKGSSKSTTSLLAGSDFAATDPGPGGGGMEETLQPPEPYTSPYDQEGMQVTL